MKMKTFTPDDAKAFVVKRYKKAVITFINDRWEVHRGWQKVTRNTRVGAGATQGEAWCNAARWIGLKGWAVYE